MLVIFFFNRGRIECDHMQFFDSRLASFSNMKLVDSAPVAGTGQQLCETAGALSLIFGNGDLGFA